MIKVLFSSYLIHLGFVSHSEDDTLNFLQSGLYKGLEDPSGIQRSGYL